MSAPGANSAVATENEHASKAGLAMLKAGGSAVDAIIAAQLVVGVIQSFMSGIGGGGFSLIRTPQGEYSTYDFRVESSADIDPSVYAERGPIEIGGRSVGVPGELRGLEAMHRQHGKIPWADLFQPAIQLAREGFEINKDLNWAILRYTLPPDKQTEPEYTRNPDSSWVFDHPILSSLISKDRKLLPVGTLITRPEYADTLDTIAVSGPDAFYKGRIAQEIVDAVQADLGTLTVSDLAEYECRKRNPLSIFIHGRKIVSTPAPSSGAVLLNALGTHAHLPKSNGPVTVEDEHRMIECLKFAYANRAHLGDPPFVPDIDRLEQEYISSETEFYNRASLEIKEDKGTSHLVAADAEGLVVSLTTTVGLAWGSRIITKSGIVLNNSLMDFSVKGAPNLFGYEPSPANYIDVNKRPLSSQCPFIIEDEKGNFAFAGGAAGGSRIISGNVQVARNVLQYGMHHPFAALSHRRLHHQLQPDEVILENNYDEKMKIELEKRGHKVRFVWSAQNIACGVARDHASGIFTASGEPRLSCSAGLVW